MSGSKSATPLCARGPAPDYRRRLEVQQAFPKCVDSGSGRTLTMDTNAYFRSVRMKVGSRILTPWGHHHEPGLGREQKYTCGLNKIACTRNPPARMIYGHVHLPNYRLPIQATFVDQKTLNSILVAVTKPEFCPNLILV